MSILEEMTGEPVVLYESFTTSIHAGENGTGPRVSIPQIRSQDAVKVTLLDVEVVAFKWRYDGNDRINIHTAGLHNLFLEEDEAWEYARRQADSLNREHLSELKRQAEGAQEDIVYLEAYYAKQEK